MKFILGVIFVLLLSVDIMADRGFDVVPKEIQEEQRVALVIGNSSYQRPLSVLNNTINDAQAIKNILSTRGFDVIYREDISKRDFSNILEEFYQKLGRGGVGLLYFSGHGLESSGQNYLIPTDAKIRAKSDTEFEAIALNKITKRMQSMGNRLNIVILDACRNDPFARSVGVGGLAKAEPIGLFVSYSTGAGAVASDGAMGENGLFTKYLIKYMKQPLTLQKVFQKTRKSVYTASSKSQFPAIYDQTINGDFYFTLPTRPISPSTQTVIYQPQPIVISEPVIQTSTSLSNGLVAHYEFEGNARDSSGNGNHGLEHAGVSYVNGVIGKASSFNGYSQYIQIPTSQKFNFNHFSISLWVNMNQSFSGNGTNVIIHKPYTSHTSFQYQWHLGVKGNEYSTSKWGDTFNFHFMAPNSQKIKTVTEIKRFSKNIIGKWKHITVTYDGKRLNTFVNSEVRSSESVNLELGEYDTDIFIAKHGNLDDSDRDFTPISVDDIYIFNRALNKSEIQKLYNMGQ